MPARASLIVVVTAVFVALLLAVPARAASVSASPSSGVAGSSTTLSGSGFSPGGTVIGCWGAPSAGCQQVGATAADSGGAISLGASIPSDAKAGDWTISVCQVDDEAPGTCLVTAATFFTVVPATTTTATTSTTTTTTLPPTTTTPSTTTSTTTTTTTTTTVAPAPAPAPAPSPTPGPTVAPAETTTTAPVLGGIPRSNARNQTSSGAPTSIPSTTIGSDDADAELVAAPAGGSTSGPTTLTRAGLDLSNPATFWGLWLAAVATVGVTGWVLVALGRRLTRRAS